MPFDAPEQRLAIAASEQGGYWELPSELAASGCGTAASGTGFRRREPPTASGRWLSEGGKVDAGITDFSATSWNISDCPPGFGMTFALLLRRDGGCVTRRRLLAGQDAVPAFLPNANRRGGGSS